MKSLKAKSSKMVGGKTGVYETHTVELPLDTVVTGPGDGEIPLKPLDRIHIRAGITRLPYLMARSN